MTNIMYMHTYTSALEASEGDDYIGFVTSLTFPAGSGPGTQLSAFITIIDDSEVENDETISIIATVLPPGQFLESGDSTTVLLIDNDCK